MGDDVLSVGPDRYNGVIIDVTKEAALANADDARFEVVLKASLAEWKSLGRRGVWLRLPPERASWIPIALRNGFSYHHAQKAYLMMCAWLADGEPNSLPNYASHYVGVGGFVLNSKDEVLVVTERYSITDRPHWKLPGGMADPGEDLADAAMREVLEETGVRTRFESLACFRHMHSYAHGMGDLYFVALLRSLTEEIRIDTNEIARCQWMPLDDYIASDIVTETNRIIARSVKEGLALHEGIYTCRVPSYDGKSMHMFYTPIRAVADSISYNANSRLALSATPSAGASEDEARSGDEGQPRGFDRGSRRRSHRLSMQMQAEKIAQIAQFVRVTEDAGSGAGGASIQPS